MTLATLIRAIALATLAALTGATPLAAQSAQSMICGQRDTVVAQLRARFGEQVRAMGLAGQTRIVEVYASEETGSWTITVTSVDGITCLLAAGQHYETVAPTPPGERM